jgi:predicted negative regulator of RcsB-dependent stress response
MEKQERHQIKENDFLNILNKVYDFYLDHQKEILYGVGTLVALLIFFYGYTHFSGSREKHAANMLAQALGADKVDMEKLKLVAGKYASFPAGKSAALLAALQSGKPAGETAGVLEKYLPKIKDDVFRGLMIYNTAILLAEGKDYDGAAKLLEKYRNQLPGEMALFIQGRIQEIKGDATEAKGLYNRLMKEYPESSLRYLAQQRLAVL